MAIHFQNWVRPFPLLFPSLCVYRSAFNERRKRGKGTTLTLRNSDNTISNLNFRLFILSRIEILLIFFYRLRNSNLFLLFDWVKPIYYCACIRKSNETLNDSINLSKMYYMQKKGHIQLPFPIIIVDHLRLVFFLLLDLPCSL